MEATAVYSNTVPVLAANGLGVTLAGTDPDHIPLEPDLINDARRRFAHDGTAVDARGAMRLHVRNALGYAFLRPHQRNKLLPKQEGTKFGIRHDCNAQAAFYRANYRHLVPHDLMMDFLENESPPQEDCYKLSKWQGNAIAGVDCGQDGHVVFYPTGHVLQQACAWYSRGELEDDPPCSSTVIETGSPIRQFIVMGSRDAYHSTKAELAVVTVDGTVRRWDPEGGVQTVKKDLYVSDRVLRCEYSSHPCVLWAANRTALSVLDLRQPAQHATKLFDVAGAGTFISIYDVKRRTSNPFQFVVGTGVSIELLDSRMARQPLMSWTQPQSYSGKQEFSFGAIDEVDLSSSSNDSRGYIVSSLKRAKVTTLFPFERNRKRKRSKVISLTPLRSNGDEDEYSDISRSSTEQLVASDATLDLRMEDGGEYTHLTGICALRNENSGSASIYQLNSRGIVFSSSIILSFSDQVIPHRCPVQLA
ncbi:hypothetical protein PInf_012819 [Phytophthora infestans]|nr:hypothetical protein PInf_012819 [Phytophthora infestans]